MQRIKLGHLACGLSIVAVVFAGLNIAVSRSVDGNQLGPENSIEAIPSQTLISNCQPAWNQVDTPDHQPEPISFNGVTAISHNEVWAVGSYVGGVPLAERWDGNSWNSVFAGHAGDGTLAAVSALASNDTWAVGINNDQNTGFSEHWDGTQWNIIPTAVLTSSLSELHGVVEVSNSDVWAVGTTSVTTGGIGVDQTLIEHWDGNNWSRIPSANINPPNDYLPNYLVAVAATSAADVWAVGYYEDGISGFSQDMIEHWDGQSWQIVPAPQPYRENHLYAVAALTANDAWAVGESGTGQTFPLLALHWDGSSWQQTNAPYPDSHTNGLRGVTMVAHNDVWAVGDYFGAVANHTLAEHWNGTTWQTVDTPGDAYEDTLFSVAAVSATDIWAVGERVYAPSPNTISIHYSIADSCLTPSPTSTASATPTPTPTLTPQRSATSTAPATNTPQATLTATPAATLTPTDCANRFVDVQGNIFYPAIHALNCAGVINGSDASHYSPSGTATRAQFAKIVVLGFGLPLATPATPDFTDVAPGYFAYAYIESGYHAGILSGFDAQSCAAAHAVYPCYLPNLAISRAQLTKLVVGAAGYPLLTPSQPSFSDVPPTNVFYAAIETAHAHGVVNGYPDGSFRPNRSIRRDEMAGIVFTAINTP